MGVATKISCCGLAWHRCLQLQNCTLIHVTKSLHDVVLQCLLVIGVVSNTIVVTNKLGTGVRDEAWNQCEWLQAIDKTSTAAL